MKKIVLFLLASLVFVAVQAQDVSLTVMKSTGGYNQDTVTSTAAHYLISQKITGRKDVTVAFKGLEISGTTAGTITLEASIDSTVWYPYYTTIAQDTTGGNYRLTLADIGTAQNFRWFLPNFGDAWVRVKCVGISTPNVQVSAKYHARKIQ